MDSLSSIMGSALAQATEVSQDSTATMVELIASILIIVAMWKIFTKAGEPGWASLIPFYNFYKLFQISMGKGWYFLLLFVPLVNYIVIILLAINISRSFGKSTGFTLGLIFLSPIFLCILGFSSAQYLGPRGFGDYHSGNSFSSRTVDFSDFTGTSNSSSSDFFDESTGPVQTVDFEVEDTNN